VSSDSYRTNFPRPVRVVEHLTIPMSDGVHLAAKLWLPEDAEDNPVPAVLELIPYRKRDGTAQRDALMHPYVAGHGYACIRVDIRGSGDSEGTLEDEYLQRELDDGVEIIAWLAAQPWCTGAVGMIGISWGGFNGLQVAALQPPSLKAIITCCSTDDRYADDVHYMGGCLLGDNLSWSAVMLSLNSLPPDPDLVGDAWRSMWHQRLEGSGVWLDTWLQHQHRDDYWCHGSICQDYSQVQCPVFAVSGWADGYSNAVFRMLERLDVPRLGLVGPWSHKYPHIGLPGPAIGFLQECVRWWDHWLKNRDTGMMELPTLRAYMLDSQLPSTGYAHRPGRWIAEDGWPTRHPSSVLHLGPGARLYDQAVDDAELSVHSPLSVGLHAGKWCSYSAPPDLPDDQREEDGGALVFDSAPLPQAMEILGAPVVELELSSDQPVAMVAVRLGDVRPDGAIARVSYGILNLTHREGHAHPKALEPGRRFTARVKLNDIAQSFPAGHRIRVAISTSYWPLAWPPPRPTRLRLFTGNSRLLLPTRAPRAADQKIVMPPVEMAPPHPTNTVEQGESSWRVIRDLGRGQSDLHVVVDAGHLYFPDIGWHMSARGEERYRIAHNDFTSATGETLWTRHLARGEFSVRTRTRQRLTCDEEHFYLDAEIDAHEGERRVFSQSFTRVIDRKLV